MSGKIIKFDISRDTAVSKKHACMHARTHKHTHTHTHTSARAILNIFIFQCCTEPDQLGGGSDFRVKNGIVNNLHSCEIVECTGIKSLVL